MQPQRTSSMKEFRRNLFAQVYEWGFNHHNRPGMVGFEWESDIVQQTLDVLPYMSPPAPPVRKCASVEEIPVAGVVRSL